MTPDCATDAAAVVTEEDLGAIADGVWESFLDIDCTAPLLPAPPQEHTMTVTASVSMTGGWQGHVVVGLSATGARLAAAALTGTAPEEVGDEDVVDAVGELVNIVGGNVKSLLPGPTVLSLPHVLVRDDGRHSWPSALEICHLDRSWCEEPVRIGVWALRAGPTETPNDL